MIKLLFKKWWLVLVQGILLVILSIYIFSNPINVLAGISIWFGLLVFAAGVLGIISWFAADETEKESMSVLWSIVSAVVGLLMLFHLLATMKVMTIFFGIWMLATGVHLTKLGWSLKEKHSFGWIIFIAGILSVITGIMVLFNIGTGAVGISILLGFQVLVAGIALIVFSLAKKALAGNIKDKLQSFNQDI